MFEPFIPNLEYPSSSQSSNKQRNRVTLKKPVLNPNTLVSIRPKAVSSNIKEMLDIFNSTKVTKKVPQKPNRPKGDSRKELTIIEDM